MKTMIFKTVKMLRIKEWLFSKVPSMFLPILTFRLCGGQENISVSMCICYLLYLFTFFGYGYAINDYSDRTIDIIVGKTNVMAELTENQCRLILAVLIFGCIPFGLYTDRLMVIPVFLFVYFWGAAYSIKPFRFKERGALGLIVSSLAQRTIPLFPLLCLSREIYIHVVFWGCVGFFTGMRYILIHQKLDMRHDALTKTRTFAGEHGERVLDILIRGIFLLEAAMQLLLLVSLSCNFQIVLLLAAYAVVLLITFYTVHYVYGQSFFGSYIFVPMEDYYNCYLPVLLCGILFSSEKWWGILLIFILAVGIKSVADKWKIIFFGIRHFFLRVFRGK